MNFFSLFKIYLFHFKTTFPYVQLTMSLNSESERKKFVGRRRREKQYA